MKKIFIICFLLFFSVSLFSQGYNYGLSQDDLNLLLGDYVPNIENARTIYRWGEASFSWGRQNRVIYNGDSFKIDYYSVQSSLFGIEYKNHLVFFNSGLLHLIRNIEKHSINIFILSLAGLYRVNDNSRIFGIRDIGQIMITFLDDRHVVIDNVNYTDRFPFGRQWWKSAGPMVTND
jgi:hypothetical protein